VFRLPIVVAVDESLLLAAVEQKHIALYAATPHATKLVSGTDLSGRTAIIIGSEGRGVSPTLQARATGLKIPTSTVESLNAAVAAGVLLYEARRQRTEA
jgi:TrmH family RNA methyltransferase